MQNLPKRNERAKIIVRSGLKPSKGNRFIEMDFSGAEVITAASYNKDPNLINYLWPKDETKAGDMHRDCYSIDTEFLTESGFKYYSEIGNTDKIAQYNEAINKIEFVLPTERTCYYYEGELYHLKNKYIDLCVTPNHRMYLKRLNKSFKIIKAQDIVKASYYYKTGADVVNTTQPPIFHFNASYGEGHNVNKKYHEEFTIQTNDMFELLGYLITDGHFKKHKQIAYRITLSQIKEPHRSKMRDCINRIKTYTNFIFHEEEGKWSMSNKVFCNWLCDNFGMNKINRKLPDFIKYAPIEQLQIFFDACMLGDGSFGRKKTSGSFFTISPVLINDFQFICMRLGYSSKVYKQPLKDGRTVQVYNIQMIFRNEYHLKSAYFIQKEIYKGEVCCFTVSSGILVVRRNNKIAIQGNCAADIWCTTPDNVSKKVRFYAKNCWTFPQFYGDWYESCAKALWEHRFEKLQDGKTCEENIIEKNIKSLPQFIEHCKDVEKIMWNERFGVYNDWRKTMQYYYQKHLTVPTYLGFEFKGYMDKKQVCNFNIQGTSFHLLLKVLLKMRQWLKENNMKTKIIGQIHDSGIFDSPDNEYKAVIKQFEKYTDELYDEFTWMEVPMKAEAEISEIDGDFGHMKVYMEE